MRYIFAFGLVALVLAGVGTTIAVTGNEIDSSQSVQVPVTDADVSNLQEDLGVLANEWSRAGGRYGYPFWEKAYQQWRDQEISDAIMREYVTGYRNLLKRGCDGVESADISTDEAQQVASMLHESCSERIEALDSQHELLSLRIEPDEQLPEEEATERLEQYESEFQLHLQESYRLARRSMNLAQEAAVTIGVSNLSQTAFV